MALAVGFLTNCELFLSVFLQPLALAEGFLKSYQLSLWLSLWLLALAEGFLKSYQLLLFVFDVGSAKRTYSRQFLAKPLGGGG